MSNEWQLLRDGKPLGTFSGRRLREMAAKRQLLPTDCLWKKGMVKQIPAGSVKELFPELASQRTSLPLHLVADRPNGQPALIKSAYPKRKFLQSGIGIVLLGGTAACALAVGVLIWSINRSQRISAEQRCQTAIAEADAHLKSPKADLGGENALTNLSTAMKDARISELTKKRAGKVLSALKQKLGEERIESIFGAADTSIREGRIEEAKELLDKYLNSGGSKSAEAARKLMDEIDHATSEQKVLAALASLDDDEFTKALASGLLPDGKVLRKELVECRKQLIAFVQQAAVKKRPVVPEERVVPKRENVDARNFVWGDSVETVRSTAIEKLTEREGQGRRIHLLVGQVAIDGEAMGIEYKFFDGHLVAVACQKTYSEGITLNKEDRQWNPYATFRTLDVLLSEKYGLCDTSAAQKEGTRLGLLDWSDWANQMPYGHTQASKQWSLPRQEISLVGICYVYPNANIRSCSLEYVSKAAEASLYKNYLDELKQQKDADSRQDLLRRAEGL